LSRDIAALDRATHSKAQKGQAIGLLVNADG
jgi:hypothetical protein